MASSSDNNGIPYKYFTQDAAEEWTELLENVLNSDHTNLISQVLAYIDKNNKKGTFVPIRHLLDYELITPEKLLYVGYTPEQILTEGYCATGATSVALSTLHSQQKELVAQQRNPFQGSNHHEKMKLSLQNNYNLQHNPPTVTNASGIPNVGNTTILQHTKRLSESFLKWTPHSTNKRSRSNSGDTEDLKQTSSTPL